MAKTNLEASNPMAAIPAQYHVPTFRNYIGGQWLCAETDRHVGRYNPADLSELVGYVPLTSKDGVARAVDTAVRAARRWHDTPPPARGKFLLRAARVLEEKSGVIAALLTREEGKTLAESHEEISLAIKVLEYMAGEGRRLSGETLASEHPGRFVYTIPQPLGVVGLITPWNYPLAVPLWKIAPALVCGNTVVWKPSRLTPLTSEQIAEVFAEVDLPAGVLNVVNGSGMEAGTALTEHPAVRGISFTSSFEVGTQIYSRAASLFKKVQCEAGGKNAAIVLSDADLDLAARDIITGAFRYSGQRCTATSRVVVVDEVADALVERLVRLAQTIVVGNGIDPETNMGPVADEGQLKRVLSFIEIGKKSAQLVCGGSRLRGCKYDRGLFISPTIFDFVSGQAELACEEIFGPILSIVRVRDFEDALETTNANRFGMVASIFTRNTEMIFEATKNLECGIVHVNGPTIGAEVHVPFGGIKDAGVGDRELGSAAKSFYTESKVVYLNPNHS